jgi:DNA-directed RNA polymerase beta' subunit
MNGGRSITMRIHGALLAELMSKNFGNGSENKVVPAWVLQAPDAFLKGLVNGYFSGDGSCSKKNNEVKAGSSSQPMLEMIQQILVRFGIMCTVKLGNMDNIRSNIAKVHPSRVVQDHYTLLMSGANAIKFAHTFDLVIDYKQKHLDRMKENYPRYTMGRDDIIPEIVTKQFGTLKDIHRDKVVNFAMKCDNSQDSIVFDNLKNETIIYDKVIAIEEINNSHEWVYDLTVKNTKNFNILSGLALSDTFHNSGTSSASKAVRGVPRMEELLSVSRNQKTPTMTIKLNPTINQDKIKVKSVMNAIETTVFGDIVKSTRIYYDPDDFNTTIESDKDFVTSYRDFLGANILTAQPTSPWLLRFELDKDKMLDYNITMMDIHTVLQDHYDENVSVMFSDDNASQLIFRIKLASNQDNGKAKKKAAAAADEEAPQERDYITELKALEKSMMESLIIKGYKNISKAAMNKVDGMQYSRATMSFEKTHEWVINTAGANMIDIIGNPDVDAYRTVSNDITEIYDLFGIEAARQALYNEINSLLDDGGLYINYRHISLLVDTMTNRGYLLAINRHGINRVDIGPLAKCAFEEVTDMITQAGIFAEIDRVTGISANVMLGQIAPIGTGDSQILIDEEKLMKLATEEYADRIAVPDLEAAAPHAVVEEVCTLDNLTFDFTMPDPASMNIPKIVAPRIKLV